MRRELFEPGDRLYFMGLLKLPAKRPEALLLNYDIGDAPKVATGIGSLCPEQPGAERVEEYGDEATDAEREMKAFYVVPAPTKKRRPAAAR